MTLNVYCFFVTAVFEIMSCEHVHVWVAQKYEQGNALSLVAGRLMINHMINC